MKEPYSNEFAVRYDPIHRKILIAHPNSKSSRSQIELNLTELQSMGFLGAAKWLGEILLLLMPEPRILFLPETQDKTSPETEIDGLILTAMKITTTKSASDLFDLAALYIARYRLKQNKMDLIQADDLLQEAAHLGDKNAIDAIKAKWKDILRSEIVTRNKNEN